MRGRRPNPSPPRTALPPAKLPRPSASNRQPLRRLDDSVDAALHEERLLGILVELAGHQPLERGDRLLELHVLALDTGELLSDREGLRHEPLDSARATDDQLVLF